MSLLVDIFSVVMISAGAFFFLAGSIGMLRFPTVLCRLHALTKADNLGLGFIALGVMPLVEWPFGPLKLALIWALVMLSSASVAQLIAISLRKQGRRGP